jgi:DNA-directed RNA polymerase subunit RPC12/RpoP
LPYRIVDWENNFENNRTRGMKEMQWVPITNRMDGAGYTALVEGPQGPSRLGCWLAIVEIASTCEVRGTLLRRSRTLLPGDLARMSRLPIDAIEDAISKLLEIEWLEEIQQEGAGKLRESGTQVRESRTILQSHKNGTEGTEGTEGKRGKRAAAPPPPPLAPSEWFESDREDIAQRIANDLSPKHWFNSNASFAAMYLKHEIATVADPDAFDAAIRENHRLWMDRVSQARLSGSLPRAIENKAFEWWVKDRLYLQEPKFSVGRSAPASPQKTYKCGECGDTGKVVLMNASNELEEKPCPRCGGKVAA